MAYLEWLAESALYNQVFDRKFLQPAENRKAVPVSGEDSLEYKRPDLS